MGGYSEYESMHACGSHAVTLLFQSILSRQNAMRLCDWGAVVMKTAQ